MDKNENIELDDVINVLINLNNNIAGENDLLIDENTRKGILSSRAIKSMFFRSKNGCPKIMRETTKRQQRKNY